MPVSNRFRHQRYVATAPTAPYRVLSAPPQPAVGSDEFLRQMSDVGRACRAAGVTDVVLMHGTFVGDDYFDLAPLLERVAQPWADRFRHANLRLVDRVLKDAGNFTPEYAEMLQATLSPPGERAIRVHRSFWSGGNGHLARAIAGIRLIDQFATLPPPALPRDAAPAGSTTASPPRILCLAHSHGGNALAVMTNLLAAPLADRRRLLEIVRPALPQSGVPGTWVAAWQRAVDRLHSDVIARELLGGRKLDLVTLGVPIRYGWDPGGYDHLLHFVNHRPVPGLPHWRAQFPSTLGDILAARRGDLVHQLGVAGSNFPLLPLRWRRWRAERKLAGLLQNGVASGQVVRRIQLGQRVHEEGSTLLVDYGISPRRGRLRELFGHGMYTHTAWMPFHFQHVAREFYGLQ